jgi:5-(carboxyamino)imidazole ribonucleotide synthase
VTSQFENHVRAVAGLPLGNTELAEGVGAAVMLNLVGTPESPEEAARHSDGHLHWYGKQARPGRKVGHVTYVGTDLAQVRTRMDTFV